MEMMMETGRRRSPRRLERSQGRRQRWERRVGAIGMRCSSHTSPRDTARGRGDRGMSHPCHCPLTCHHGKVG